MNVGFVIFELFFVCSILINYCFEYFLRNSFSFLKDVSYTVTLSQTKCVAIFFPRHTFMFLITNTNKPRLFQKKDILETLNKGV